MNYQYMDAYLEITFPSGNIRRIKKSRIKEISQFINDGKPYVMIWVEGESYRFNGTFEYFEENSKTVFI